MVSSCSVYYREAVAITPGMAAVVAIAIMITIGMRTVGALKFDEKQHKSKAAKLANVGRDSPAILH